MRRGDETSQESLALLTGDGIIYYFLSWEPFPSPKQPPPKPLNKRLLRTKSYFQSG